MAYDELELDRIGDRKTAVFFIISDTTQTYNFLVALAFSQMFNLLCERADNVHGGRLPHHVRVLWDEAANTGQVPQLEKLVAVIRSREVSLCLLYQQLAQCKAIYDKHAETILGNMDSVVFLGGREASTIKEISENWLGKATISMQTDSRSRGQSESYSQNTQRLGRELMTPAELATMPGDKCILQLRGLPPFFSPKYDLKRHPNYRYTAEADKQKNAFDLDRLINRRRRPGLNEACTMYEVTVPDDALTEEDEDILNYKNRSRTACTMHSIKHERLEAAVLFAVQHQVHLAVSYSEIVTQINSAPIKKSQSYRLDDLIAAKERELTKITRYKQSLYQDWKDGEITQQEYRDMKADYERQTSDISAVLTRLNAERAELANGVDNEHPALVAFMKYQNIEALNREILVELVDYIKVYENGNISVKFKFADELRKIAEYIEINTTEDTAVAG